MNVHKLLNGKQKHVIALSCSQTIKKCKFNDSRMFTMITLSRCSLSTAVPRIFKNHAPVPLFEDVKKYLSRENQKTDESNKDVKKKTNFPIDKKENIKIIQTLFEKYDVEITNDEDQNKIYTECPYSIEKKILLLQELKVSEVTTKLISNLIKAMNLPVSTFKSYSKIDPELNLAENLFSWVENSNIDIGPLKDLDENMIMKRYYCKCLVHYIKHELNLNEAQTERVSFKQTTPIYINSMRLLQRFLKFLKNDLGFSNDLITKSSWVFSQHPDQALLAYETVKDQLKEHTLSVIQKYPKLLEYDLNDLSLYISYLKEYDINMIRSAYQIFHIGPAEFKRRMDDILNNPFTLVFKNHPKFLLLVRDYHVIVPKLKYLEEKNLKFATIHSLTTFHDPFEQLLAIKKMNIVNLKAFFDLLFGNYSGVLLKRFKKHSFYSYVPLVAMLESLIYLKEHYSKKIIRRHIYAILYNKEDLHTAREILMKDPCYSESPANLILALCVYKIEEKCHFTGEAVLTPQKYTECIREELAENKIEGSNE